MLAVHIPTDSAHFSVPLTKIVLEVCVKRYFAILLRSGSSDLP